MPKNTIKITSIQSHSSEYVQYDNTLMPFWTHSYSVDPIDEEEEREAGEDSDFELLDDIDLDDSVQMVNLISPLHVFKFTHPDIYLHYKIQWA